MSENDDDPKTLSKIVEHDNSETARQSIIKFAYKNGKFSCFSCFKHDIDIHRFKVYTHKKLGTALCETCFNRHGGSRWHKSVKWKERSATGKRTSCEVCTKSDDFLKSCGVCGFSYCIECLNLWVYRVVFQECGVQQGFNKGWINRGSSVILYRFGDFRDIFAKAPCIQEFPCSTRISAQNQI